MNLPKQQIIQVVPSVFDILYNTVGILLTICIILSTILAFYKGKHGKKVRVGRLICAILNVIIFSILTMVSINEGVSFVPHMYNLVVWVLLSGYYGKGVKKTCQFQK